MSLTKIDDLFKLSQSDIDTKLKDMTEDDIKTLCRNIQVEVPWGFWDYLGNVLSINAKGRIDNTKETLNRVIVDYFQSMFNLEKNGQLYGDALRHGICAG